MEQKIGFIGAGNMGSAILHSVVKGEITESKNIYLYDINEKRCMELHDELGVTVAENPARLVAESDIIILAVKPDAVESALKDCSTSFDGKKVLVSIAVGIPIRFYKNILGDNKKIIRAMPNTPALVGEGMTLICYDDNVADEDVKNVIKLFRCTGQVDVLKEELMSEVTALTGSSPAYVFMFIEAMSDSAVLSGLPRKLSYKLAAQAVLGSAKMVLETGKHPAELKDIVCSPAGTTIEAVASLEKDGFRSSVIQAMNACTKRAKEIGRAVDGNI